MPNWLDPASMPLRPLEYAWRMYLSRDADTEDDEFYSWLRHDTSQFAQARQRALWEGTELTPTQADAIAQYTFNSNTYVNDYLRDGTNEPMDREYTPEGIDALSAARRAQQLAQIVENVLPNNGPVMLYRGGYGHRGTSGEHFRQNKVKPGDVLVNSDFLSFTENPYTVAKFCRSWSDPTDETSVVFQLTKHHSPKPIAPLSAYPGNYEDESLCPPMRHFVVTGINAVEPVVDDVVHPLVVVSIEELPDGATGGRRNAGPVGTRFFDFRTGEPFDFARIDQRINAD